MDSLNATVKAGCNHRCFQCKYPDCIDEVHESTRSPALIRAQKKYQDRKPQAVKDARKRYYEKNRERLKAQMRERYHRLKGEEHK